MERFLPACIMHNNALADLPSQHFYGSFVGWPGKGELVRAPANIKRMGDVSSWTLLQGAT